MRWFRFAGLILLVMIVQASVLANLDRGPNLLLILLAFFCIYCDLDEAIITSFAIGFAADLSGASMPMGPQTLSFGLLGTALAHLRRVVNIRNMPSQALAIFAVALLAGAIAQFLAIFKGQAFTAQTWGILLGVAVYSGVVGPFLFLPSAWWMRVRPSRLAR